MCVQNGFMRVQNVELSAGHVCTNVGRSAGHVCTKKIHVCTRFFPVTCTNVTLRFLMRCCYNWVKIVQFRQKKSHRFAGDDFLKIYDIERSLAG